MEKNKVILRISGMEYSIRGYESEEYLHKLGLFVDRKMTEIVSSNNRLSTHMAAILTALNVADELLKIKDEKNLQSDALQKLNSEINDLKKINERLKDENSVLTNSNTKLQLELVKIETELKEARKPFDKNINRNNYKKDFNNGKQNT